MSPVDPIDALAAVGIARARRTEAELTDPATRVLDVFGREWMRKLNGTWAALGHDLTADSLADIEATHGPVEVLA